MNSKILVIGDSNSGKTHLAIQLYGRVFKSEKPVWKPEATPNDLTIFQGGFQRLSSGLAIEHTPRAFNDTISLSLKNATGDIIEFNYPDYAGEQIKTLVEDRKVNDVWKKQVVNSTSWLLMLRPGDVQPLEDLVTRGFPAYDQFVQPRSAIVQEEFKLKGQAFYLELLQMLAHIKGLQTKTPISSPHLVVALSCWDELSEEDAAQNPARLLKAKMPMIYYFVKAHWHPNALLIIGLSSTGRKLSNTEPDEDYIDLGPEDFGYIIDSQGRKNNDLTEIFTLLS